jgi:tRNA G37 N-methylase Trm5
LAEKSAVRQSSTLEKNVLDFRQILLTLAVDCLDHTKYQYSNHGSIRALKHDTGGWLHVHGNVRNAEKNTWSCWLRQRLLDINCQEEGVHHHAQSEEWIVLCNHVERVKSFAPTFSHYRYVADVFVGPPHRHPRS